MPDEMNNEQVIEQPISSETTIQGDCPNCKTPNTTIHKCSVCGNDFCKDCPGNHTPPQSNSFESKVHFLYKVKGTTTPWKEDIVRFSDIVSTPLCTSCWDNECNKLIWRFKWKIKNWKQDLLRDEDLKIIEESMPACGIEDKNVVKSALDFLGDLQKTKK